MAKQKAKLPLKRAPRLPVAAAEPATGVPRKGKAKSVGKLKAKGLGDAALPDGVVVPRKRLVKAKRKPPRRKHLPALPPAADPLVKSLGALPPAVAAPVRARKLRPAPPLGRLDRLEIAINEVRIGGRQSTRTRKLLASGIPKMAQKVIEEAAEVAIEAIRGEHAAFVNEAVDLFFNLLTLSSELGVPLAAIWAEMDRREQALGMAEKLPKSGDP